MSKFSQFYKKAEVFLFSPLTGWRYTWTKLLQNRAHSPRAANQRKKIDVGQWNRPRNNLYWQHFNNSWMQNYGWRWWCMTSGTFITITISRHRHAKNAESDTGARYVRCFHFARESTVFDKKWFCFLSSGCCHLFLLTRRNWAVLLLIKSVLLCNRMLYEEVLMNF